MNDNLYLIKDVSKLLDCSTQNIYRQKQELLSKGYMEQAETGTFYINEKGINYLREKRIEAMRSNPVNEELSSLDNQQFKSVATPVTPSNNVDLIKVLERQIEDLKQEKEYWKNKFNLKDEELSKANEHLQNMNTTVFQKLLASSTEKEEKKGFFKRLFG